MFISRHTLKWTKTCRSSGDFPHAHTAHFLLNRHTVARRKSAYTRDLERQVAWLSVHAPRSAVSALMRVDWKSVGPICRRVPLGHRGVLEARREDRPPPLRHPAHHPVRTIQRSPGGRQQQDQDHHQDGLRLQEPRQPHRSGHAQMRRPQPPTPRTPITRKPDQGPTPTQTPEEPFFFVCTP